MAKIEKKALVYQTIVTVAGLSMWLASVAFLFTKHPAREQLILTGFIPLIIVISLFPNTFTLPGLKRDRITFTLSDAFIFLIACWYGIIPAVFVAGAEGFVSSRRSVRRLSSNLFSAGMISLASAAAALALNAILRFGFHEANTNRYYSFVAVTVALLPATVAHVLVNVGLLSGLYSLRLKTSFFSTWKDNLSWAAPIALPTSAVASLAYLALQNNWLVMVIIGAPILIAINFGHRQYRNNMLQRIELLEKAHRETIEALAVAINAKDEVTHEHVLRVQIYAAGVARLFGCDEAEIEALRAGALLHDIGKIAVPDYILNKPGKLTAPEFEQMKMHTIVGAQILGRVDFPYPVVPIVRHHHERWDGAGYPDGLSDEQIPLTARILTVVDCFDALREDRQYRRGLSREEAIEFLMKNSGTQYDPRVVGIFITHLPEFEAEIAAHKGQPLPTFGIEAAEELSAAARQVVPGAGLAVNDGVPAKEVKFAEKELAAFYELVQAANSARDRDELCEAFAERLQAVVEYDTCTLTLIAPDSGQIVVEYAFGRNANLIKGRQIALGEGITGWVIANQKRFCNTDPRLDFPPALADHFQNYQTLASFPLLKHDELRGAITLYSSTSKEYTDEQQRLLQECAAVLTNLLPSQFHSAGSGNKTSTARAISLKCEGDLQGTFASSSVSSELTH
ncbi:MAG TPA: HD domain-containing phosphohydrolase [Pyrinomonadaceae bacterium]|nr:HD domain-containing phosphohydrolase [Pyrinomonadaceae bacterium]